MVKGLPEASKGLKVMNSAKLRETALALVADDKRFACDGREYSYGNERFAAQELRRPRKPAELTGT